MSILAEQQDTFVRKATSIALGAIVFILFGTLYTLAFLL